jgi:hypothetical protein
VAESRKVGLVEERGYDEMKPVDEMRVLRPEGWLGEGGKKAPGDGGNGLLSASPKLEGMRPKVLGKGRRRARETDRGADLDTDRPAAPTEAGEERRKEKTAGLLFLALLFAFIFWDAYWFLSKFLLAFVIVYVLYLVARSRS